jgi:hypothetical protein
MNKSNILNNEKLSYSYNFKSFFLNKMYGLKLKTLNIFEKRLELFSNIKISGLSAAQYTALLKVFYQIVPNKQSLQEKNLFNIFFLDIINSYRG